MNFLMHILNISLKLSWPFHHKHCQQRPVNTKIQYRALQFLRSWSHVH